MPTDHSKWATKQINAAIAIGVNPIDAARAAKWVLDHLPPGADPDTYIFSADEMMEDLTSEAILADARADWFSKVDPRDARLLDATGVE